MSLARSPLVAAPLYAKFGLRNARPVYPAGEHLRGDVVGNVREKSAEPRSPLSGSTTRHSISPSPSRGRGHRSTRTMTLRSDRWVRGDDEVALDSRVALRMGGAGRDA